MDLGTSTQGDVILWPGNNQVLTAKVSGNVGIGTANPTAKLEVAGQVKITGGAPGAGKVLTSDATGLASWTTPTASSSFWSASGNDINNTNSGEINIGNPPASYYGKLNVEGGAAAGVYGGSNSNVGVAGASNTNYGGLFTTNTGIALVAGSSGSGPAIVANTGNVGIGTMTPTEKLTISSGRLRFFGSTVSNTTGGVIELTGTAFMEVGGTWASNFNNADNLGSTTKRWNTVYATNGTINTSDAREKQNVQSLGYGLQQVMQMHPVTYEWKARPEQGRKIGFIAQELQTLVPEVVSDTEWRRDENNKMVSKPAEVLGVYYSDLIPVLTKAIQEQQVQIEALRAELDALRDENASLRTAAGSDTQDRLVQLETLVKQLIADKKE